MASCSNKTTTIFGRYESDTKGIIEELGIPKSTDFGANQGGFKVLNTPDEYYVTATNSGRNITSRSLMLQ